jgi:hypothetical protein
MESENIDLLQINQWVEIRMEFKINKAIAILLFMA